MPLDPPAYLKILDDAFTPVRDSAGHLLGCIPKIADGQNFIMAPSGQMFDLGWAIQPCVQCDLATQSPEELAGFVGLDDTDTDLAQPAGELDDADLGEPI